MAKSMWARGPEWTFTDSCRTETVSTFSLRPRALAHLGLDRAYMLQSDTAKAKVAYQDFLTLWKDADLDIPILKEAKVE